MMGDKEGYSTLEVDEHAQSQHEKFLAQQELNNPLHNLPEVDTRANDDNLPQVPYSDLPEAVRRDTIPPEAAGSGKKPTVCGIRRRTFWILLGVGIAIIVAAALAGGLAGGLSKSSKSTTGDASSNHTTTSNSTTSPDDSGDTSILPTTRLASLNFTDEAGYANYLIFYQLQNQHLYQSAYNSSTQNWTVSLFSDDTSNIKNQTPIACNSYWYSTSRYDFHVYWLSPANVIQGRIFSSTVAATSPANWSTISALGSFTASSTSSLAAYSRECADCLNENLLFWEAPASDTLMYWDGSSAQNLPSNLSAPANGTSLALASVRTEGSTKEIVIYLRAEGGNLTQYVYNGVASSGWSNVTLPTSPSPASALAAFTSGYNDTSSSSNSPPATFQILSTRPRSTAGGAKLTSFSSTGWADDGAEAVLSSVIPDSGMAANQDGRVYGVRDGTGGYELVEWAWSSGSGSGSGTGSYAVVGVVNTTVTAE